jgi:type 1 glutamine amidotransferase
VLVFTKTAGYRHASIPAAIQAIRDLGARTGFDVTATEDDTTFSAAGLAPYDAVIFLLTTGDVLDGAQQTAFETYIRAGHGYAGVHSAADTERDWPWYGRLVGAWSSGHPEIQPATIDVVTPRDDSTVALPARWSRTDEWYSWLTNPRANGVRVLLTLDESTYLPGEFAIGADHPIAWEHAFDGGRAWYTAGGHTEESYGDPAFLGHLLGGIRYALGTTASDGPAAQPKAVGPTVASRPFSVRGRRIVVRARYANCVRCRAWLRVRSQTRRLHLSGLPPCPPNTRCRRPAGLASGSSAVLPPGRLRATLIFTDLDTGLSRRVSRWVRIPAR